MSEISTIGLDIAKQVFHAHGADARGHVLFSKRISRGKLLAFFAAQPRCVVALEACGGAHHWARGLAHIIGRGPDLCPMPGCCEWDLTDRVLFQVLDNPKQGAVDVVSLRLDDLDQGIARLRDAGFSIDDPEPVPGFDTLRIATIADPDGNTLNLLGGE